SRKHRAYYRPDVSYSPQYPNYTQPRVSPAYSSPQVSSENTYHPSQPDATVVRPRPTQQSEPVTEYIVPQPGQPRELNGPSAILPRDEKDQKQKKSLLKKALPWIVAGAAAAGVGVAISRKH